MAPSESISLLQFNSKALRCIENLTRKILPGNADVVRAWLLCTHGQAVCSTVCHEGTLSFNLEIDESRLAVEREKNCLWTYY